MSPKKCKHPWKRIQWGAKEDHLDYNDDSLVWYGACRDCGHLVREVFVSVSSSPEEVDDPDYVAGSILEDASEEALSEPGSDLPLDK